MLMVNVLLVVLLLVAFPTTGLGRTLRRFLVDTPARRLNAIKSGQVVFYIGLGVAGLGLFCLFETDGLRLFMFMAPDLLVWFTVFDISLFVDVFIVSATLAAGTRVRGSASAITRKAGRICSAAIARMSGRERRSQARPNADADVANDPDPDGWLLATA